MKKILFLFTTFVFLFFLGKNRFVFSAEGKNQEPVQVFATDKTGKPYVVLGQILAKATQNEKCIQKLKKKTLENGGNLIINFDSSATGTVGIWSGASVIICRGVAARWTNHGEQGQTSMDPNAPLPVLTK